MAPSTEWKSVAICKWTNRCYTANYFFHKIVIIRLYTAHCKTISCVIKSTISVSSRSFTAAAVRNVHRQHARRCAVNVAIDWWHLWQCRCPEPPIHDEFSTSVQWHLLSCCVKPFPGECPKHSSQRGLNPANLVARVNGQWTLVSLSLTVQLLSFLLDVLVCRPAGKQSNRHQKCA